MVYTTYTHVYTHIHNPCILHIHSLNCNSLNSLLLLLLKNPTAVGTKDVEYLTVLNLGALTLPLACYQTLIWVGMCCLVRCICMSISLFTVCLWYSASMEPGVFPITSPIFLINSSILLLSWFDRLPPQCKILCVLYCLSTTVRLPSQTMWKHLRSWMYRTSGGAANWHQKDLSQAIKMTVSSLSDGISVLPSQGIIQKNAKSLTSLHPFNLCSFIGVGRYL